MLTFPNAKINLGLRIIEKRPDGFHNIETIFIPVPVCDILEIIPVNTDSSLTTSGLAVEGALTDNICLKALTLFQREIGCSNVAMHLHKIIPTGAGLGGGSSDAAFTLKLLASLFSPKISHRKLLTMASQLGSDCAFFIENTPSIATGKGEVLQAIEIDLHNHYLVLVSPRIHVSTAEAYNGIIPKQPAHSLQEFIHQPIKNWQNTIVNDFEITAFKANPALQQIKEKLIHLGAVYAAMTGSGSTIFGLFKQDPGDLSNNFVGSELFAARL
jgi:4-diphosphocytidyl-2C-methyl-D-erythritol kinase